MPHGDGWAVIGFLDRVDGAFVGELTDPLPVRYHPDAGLLARTPDGIALSTPLSIPYRRDR